MSSTRPITLYRPAYESVRLIQCSPPSWMVELGLEEKGLEFTVKALSFARGEHRTPDMLARNPRGTIPVLTHGDAVLWESLAILEYLDFVQPTPPLLGSDAHTRARALNRLHESDALKRAGMELFAYLMRAPENVPENGPEGGPGDERLASLLQAFRQELGWWERTYGESTWAAGETLTLADITVFAYVATAVYLGFSLAPAYPRVSDAFERMRTRPSVQKTWPETWKNSPARRVLAR